MLRLQGKSFLFVIFFISSSLGVFAQHTLLSIGNKEYEMFEYIDAQKTYLKLAETGYESAELFEKLGNTYYFNGLYEEASKWYEKLIVNYGGSVESEYYYRYAQTLKSVGNYKEADLYMRTFAKVSPEDSRVELYLKKLGELEKLKRSLKRYSVKNLGMNSSYRDFGTSYYGNSVVISSSRGNPDEEPDNLDEWAKEPFVDMYIATRDTVSNELYEIGRWGFDLGLNESTPVFTRDLKTVYFTANAREGRKYRRKKKGEIKTNQLKIYRSLINEKGEWSKPEELPFCSDEYATAHPSLNKDATRMYFSSDMPGGKGESDIYEVKVYSNGTFGEPRNLGDIINTEGRETFPFVTKEDVLYFSSDGHVGFGGLDVFVARISDLENGKDSILNLGEIINSKEDDFGFVIQESRKKGYFSSNRREGKGKDDIYSFEESVLKVEDDLVKKLELNNIYFDLDKSFIRPDASVILDEIVDVLNAYPQMEIDIRSHTDSRATKYYNLKLSDRRAYSTKRYLIENGIKEERLTSHGYGEIELVNHCGDGVKCSEEEHQLNRRSEFIITKI
nr:OmpA family protein [uncultured Allomuricauda sp.]